MQKVGFQRFSLLCPVPTPFHQKAACLNGSAGRSLEPLFYRFFVQSRQTFRQNQTIVLINRFKMRITQAAAG
jgi:hypothetical protein